MMKVLLFISLIFFLIGCSSAPEKELQYKENDYFLRICEVKGRQGVSTDGDNIYISGTKKLYKYDMKGKLLVENLSPFKNINLEVNHLGDIDLHKEEIYTCIERFTEGRGDNFVIGIYNKNDLSLVRTIIPGKNSPQKEISGIAVDPERKLIWMTDWTDGKSIYYYDIATGDYIGRIILKNELFYLQGIVVHKNYLLLTADDGDAENEVSDNLYAIKINMFADVISTPIHLKEFEDVKREGEIEGITINRKNGELIVLFNRGAKIIKGIPKGFYLGYDKEIHEIYFYKNIGQLPED